MNEDKKWLVPLTSSELQELRDIVAESKDPDTSIKHGMIMNRLHWDMRDDSDNLIENLVEVLDYINIKVGVVHSIVRDQIVETSKIEDIKLDLDGVIRRFHTLIKDLESQKDKFQLK